MDALPVGAAASVASPEAIDPGILLNSLLFGMIALGLVLIGATVGRIPDPVLRRALLPLLTCFAAFEGLAFPLYFLTFDPEGHPPPRCGRACGGRRADRRRVRSGVDRLRPGHPGREPTSRTPPAGQPHSRCNMWRTTSASAIGPLAAGLLYRLHVEWLFAGDAITTFASLVVVAALVRESLPGAEARAAAGRRSLAEREVRGGTLAALAARPLLFAFSAGALFLLAVSGQYGFGLPLHAVTFFGKDGPRIYGALMTVNALVVIATAPLLAPVSRRLGAPLAIALGGLLYSAGFGALAVVHGLPAVVASTLTWSLGEVLIMPNIGVFLADNSPSSHRGRLGGLVPLLSGVGCAASPPLAGMLVERSGTTSLWVPVAAVAALGATIFLLLARLPGRGQASAAREAGSSERTPSRPAPHRPGR